MVWQRRYLVRRVQTVWFDPPPEWGEMDDSARDEWVCSNVPDDGWVEGLEFIDDDELEFWEQ